MDKNRKFVPKSQDERGKVEGSVLIKNCEAGTVSSENWISSYVVIERGLLRIFDDSKTNILVEFPLDSKRRPSSWKRKDYSNIEGVVANLYTFYILKDSVIFSSFMYKRKLKIGCASLEFAEKLIRCIEFNTEHPSTEFLKD